LLSKSKRFLKTFIGLVFMLSERGEERWAKRWRHKILVFRLGLLAKAKVWHKQSGSLVALDNCANNPL